MTTELVLTERDEQALATFAITFPQFDITDVNDIMCLAQVPGVMRAKGIEYEPALEQVGLNPRTVRRWRQARPHIFLISAQLALTRLEPEIDAMLAAARPDIISDMIQTATTAKKASDRRGAAAYLERHYYGAMDAGIEAREKEIHEKTGVGAVKKRQMTKFEPARHELNINLLSIGAQRPHFAEHIEGEFEEEE